MTEILLFAVLVCTPSDLTHIDRTIKREPKYTTEPRYCLLVFGPDATDRVWVVEAGNKFYVDRNGNLDLTDPNESFEPSKTDQFYTLREGKRARYLTETFEIGELVPNKDSAKHTEFTLKRVSIGDQPAIHIFSVMVNGTLKQYAGWHPMFANSPQDAPVVHFGGSVISQRLRVDHLTLASETQELHFRLGTPGIGKHSFASIAETAIPKEIHPVVEINWPTPPGAKEPVVSIATLENRC